MNTIHSKAIWLWAATAAAALSLAGCFKSVATYTRYDIAVYRQTSPDGDFLRVRDLDTYAYYVDTTEWRIASYDDAVAGRITNKLTGETRETPDVWGAFNSSGEYQCSLVLTEPLSMIVAVDTDAERYAYRSYELPVNLPQVYTKLYMAVWRPTHTSSGWVVVNMFHVPDSPENPDDPETPDTPDTPDDPAAPETPDGGGAR